MFPCLTCFRGFDPVTHSLNLDPTCPELRKAVDKARKRNEDCMDKYTQFMEKMEEKRNK
jgi:hypothetical protein